MTETDKSNIKITKLPHSEVEIEGEISAKIMDAARKKALKKLLANAALPGFRKGHVPEAMFIKHVGEMAVLEEAAEIALGEAYPDIISKNDIKAIGRPHISITKIAPNNPLGFKIKTAIMPEITLAPYKKIAQEHSEKKSPKIEVTEKEIDAVIDEVRKNKVPHIDNKEDKKTDETKNLPELTDEFVQTLGDFKDIQDFKNKIKENITHEKEHAEKEKRRLELVDRLINESTIDLPEILIEGELEKMLAQFKDDIERMGIKSEEYLKHLKKTEDDLKKEWRENAEKKGKLQLILNKISLEEKIKPDEAEVKKEIDHILEHHKDADRFRVRMYVETYITNNKVFEFLERKN